MQNQSTEKAFIPKEFLEQIRQCIRNGCQAVEEAVSKVKQFGINNKNQRQRWKGLHTINHYEHFVYTQNKYYEAQVSTKQIQKLLDQLLTLHLVSDAIQPHVIEQPINNCIGETTKCLESINGCRQILNRKTTYSEFSQSFNFSLNYLKDLHLNVEAIHACLIMAKETVVKSQKNKENKGRPRSCIFGQAEQPKNQPLQTKDNSYYLQLISNDLSSMLSQMMKFSEKYATFTQKYPIYQNTKVVVNSLIKNTNVTIKDKSKLGTYKQTATDSMQECKNNLVFIQRQIKERSSNLDLSPGKMQYVSNVQLHMNSLKKYLETMKSNLVLINENFIMTKPTQSKNIRMTFSSTILSPKSVNQLRTSSNQHIKITKDDRPIDQILSEVLGLISSTDNQLSKIMPSRQSPPPFQITTINLNFKKIIQIQKNNSVAVDIVSTLLERVNQQEKPSSQIKLNRAESKSKIVETSNNQNTKQNTANFEQTIRVQLQQLIEKDSAITRLNRQLNEIKMINQGLFKQKESLQVQINTLRGEYKNLQNQYNDLQVSIDLMTSNTPQQNNPNSDNQLIASLTQQNQELTQQLNSLNKKLQQQRKINNENQSKIKKQNKFSSGFHQTNEGNNNKKSNNNMSQIMDYDEEKFVDLTEQEKNGRKSIISTDNVKQPQQSRIIQQQQQQQQGNHQQDQQAKTVYKIKISALCQQVAQLEQKVKDNKQELESTVALISQVQQQQSQLSDKLRQKQQLLNNINGRQQQAVNVGSSIRGYPSGHELNSSQQLTSVNVQYQNRNNQLTAIKNSIQSLQSQQSLLKSILQDLKDQHMIFMTTAFSSTSQASSIKALYEQGQLTIQQQKQQIISINKQKQQLTAHLLKLQQEMQTNRKTAQLQLSKSLKALQDQNTLINNQLTQSNSKWQQQAQSLDALVQEVRSKEKDLKAKEDEIKTLRAQIARSSQCLIIQQNIEGQKKSLQKQIRQLINQFTPKPNKHQHLLNNQSNEIPTDQLFSTLRSIWQQKQQHLLQLTTRLKQQFSQLQTQCKSSYNKKQQQLQTQTNTKLNELIKKFNLVNTQLATQRDQLYAKNQSLTDQLSVLNGYMKQVYLVNCRYLTAKALESKLDAELLSVIEKKADYELTAKDAENVLLSIVAVIYESEARCSVDRRYVQVYSERIGEYRKLFIEAIGLEDLVKRLRALRPSHVDSDSSCIDNQIESFALQTIDQLKKVNSSATIQREAQLKQAYTDDIVKTKENLKTRFDQELRIKDKQIQKLVKVQQQRKKQQALLKSSNQKLDTNQKQNLRLTTEITKLKGQIELLNKSMQQLKQKSITQKKNFQAEKQSLNHSIDDLEDNIAVLNKNINDLKQQLRKTKDNMSRNQSSIQQEQQEKQKLTKQLKVKEDELKRKISQLNTKSKLLKDTQDQLERTRSDLSAAQREIQALRRSTSSWSDKAQTQLNQLKLTNMQLNARCAQLVKQLGQTKDKHSKTLEELNLALDQKEKLSSQLNFSKQILTEIELTLREKLNLQQYIEPKKLPQALKNFSPVATIGCKLITSIIIHGYDVQRSDILKRIQSQSGKKIKRTDVLARYPDIKSMIYNVPKQGAFIMLYKTANGRVVGTFSEGLKKKTFVFAYWTEEEDKYGEKIRQASNVVFYMPQTPSAKVSSVDLNERKYLKYGNDELRINLMDMATISANSDVSGDRHYGDFKWTDILGDKNENKLALNEVEMHKVEFE